MVLSVNRGTVWVGTKVHFHDNSVLEILTPWKIFRKETQAWEQQGISQALPSPFRMNFIFLHLWEQVLRTPRVAAHFLIPFLSSLNIPTATTPVISQPLRLLWIFGLACRVFYIC